MGSDLRLRLCGPANSHSFDYEITSNAFLIVHSCVIVLLHGIFFIVFVLHVHFHTIFSCAVVFMYAYEITHTHTHTHTRACILMKWICI